MHACYHACYQTKKKPAYIHNFKAYAKKTRHKNFPEIVIKDYETVSGFVDSFSEKWLWCCKASHRNRFLKNP